MTGTKKVLFIDNYDSFSYNIVQYLGELGAEVMVFRNDQISIEQCQSMSPDMLVISPGPGGPSEAGISCELIRAFSGKLPILGICLGHQCIYQVFGGTIINSPTIVHGKTSAISHDNKGLFKSIPQHFNATRYHSLVGDPKSLPNDLEVTCTTSDGIIMGVRHKKRHIEGVQFHPESIMSEYGKEILRNFLSIV